MHVWTIFKLHTDDNTCNIGMHMKNIQLQRQIKDKDNS